MGANIPVGASRDLVPHYSRASGRNSGYLPLELPRCDTRPEDRAGAGVRKHRRVQTCLADALVCGVRDATAREGRVACGVVNLVMGAGSVLGDALVADKRIRGITFTGSTDTGVRLYQAAASRLAAVQLELGGKNPAVVLDYDDLDGAAQEIVSAAFLCSGQRCTALSRVIVGENQAEALVERIVARVKRIEVGDGMLEITTMGPLVSKGQFETVESYVRQGIEAGFDLVAGGNALVDDPDRQGFYYEPTVFDNVAPNSSLAEEEIFGPVLPIIRVRDAEEAIALANGTRYGLAAALFTSRPELIAKFTARVQAGMIHINHGTASQAHVPFGGRKESGQGAFSIGPTAKDFFTNVKAVYVKG